VRGGAGEGNVQPVADSPSVGASGQRAERVASDQAGTVPVGAPDMINNGHGVGPGGALTSWGSGGMGRQLTSKASARMRWLSQENAGDLLDRKRSAGLLGASRDTPRALPQLQRRASGADATTSAASAQDAPQGLPLLQLKGHLPPAQSSAPLSDSGLAGDEASRRPSQWPRGSDAAAQGPPMRRFGGNAAPGPLSAPLSDGEGLSRGPPRWPDDGGTGVASTAISGSCATAAMEGTARTTDSLCAALDTIAGAGLPFAGEFILGERAPRQHPKREATIVQFATAEIPTGGGQLVDVALKFYLSRRRFDTEVRASADSAIGACMPLTHGFLDGTDSAHSSGFAFPPCAVMYRGLTLNEWAALGPREYVEVLHVLQGAAAALQGVHEAGYAHRDVKPGNILFWDGRWVLSDFGYLLKIGAPLAPACGRRSVCLVCVQRFGLSFHIFRRLSRGHSSIGGSTAPSTLTRDRSMLAAPSGMLREGNCNHQCCFSFLENMCSAQGHHLPATGGAGSHGGSRCRRNPP
jgi:hypothetical protein